jgi:hypothetical protein
MGLSSPKVTGFGHVYLCTVISIWYIHNERYIIYTYRSSLVYSNFSSDSDSVCDSDSDSNFISILYIRFEIL